MDPTGIRPAGTLGELLPPLLAALTVGGGFVLLATRRLDRRDRAVALAAPVAAAPSAPLRPAPREPRLFDDEANIPRWLRPSVREARFWQPSRVPRPAVTNPYREGLSFDAPPPESASRLVLRYDHVELLDQPNEALAQALAMVRADDEVEVLEVRDAWARVQTPRGLIGWLPTMTLAGPTTSRAHLDAHRAGGPT